MMGLPDLDKVAESASEFGERLLTALADELSGVIAKGFEDVVTEIGVLNDRLDALSSSISVKMTHDIDDTVTEDLRRLVNAVQDVATNVKGARR